MRKPVVNIKSALHPFKDAKFSKCVSRVDASSVKGLLITVLWWVASQICMDLRARPNPTPAAPARRLLPQCFLAFSQKR